MKRFAFLAGLAAVLIGCASQPLVTIQPTVSVSDFKSVSFSPQRIEFDARLLVQNSMPADLELQKIDWAVDLYDQELFTDSLNGLRSTNANGSQTFSLPFHIAMKDVAEEKLKLTFRGQVFPAARYGMNPVPFTQTIEVPVPKPPEVAYAGSEGEPFSEAFRLNFQVTNTNAFPITLMTVRTFLVINDQNYTLLHTLGSVDMKPQETRPVALQMQNFPGKALSMALNLAEHPNPTFYIMGTVTFKTPYGLVYVPLSLEEILK